MPGENLDTGNAEEGVKKKFFLTVPFSTVAIGNENVQ